MRRDLPLLASRTYDIVVVGGGIYGICLAREAARRGYTVCLLERGDFLGGTSSQSLRILHGGLRYLQHLDLGRMRQSIAERRLLQRLAPHLVRPLPFVMPTSGHGLRSREVLALALALNDVVSADRNAGLAPEHRIPRGRVLSRAELAELVPDLPLDGVTGGALWYDCQIGDSERLAFAFLRSAVDAGAICANYVDVVRLLERGGRVTGVLAEDGLGGGRFEVRGRLVLNAAGPWVDALLGRLGRPGLPRQFAPSKAINLVTRRLVGAHALGLAGRQAFRDGDAVLNKGVQLFFIVPWREYSLIGTRHFPQAGGADDFAITTDDVNRFVHEINAAYPAAALARRDILAVWGGMLPAAPGGAPGGVRLVKHARIRDHRRDGVEGLVTVVGVKWTTARRVAETALELVASRLGRPVGAPSPPEGALPGGAIGSPETFVAQALARRPPTVGEASLRHLASSYGSLYPEVLAPVSAAPDLGRPIHPGSPVIGAEVIYAVRQEMAQRLPDVVLRRTALAAGGRPPAPALQACASLMGGELGWSPERCRAEVQLVEGATRLPWQRAEAALPSAAARGT
jgi:glycerol-3-phosphate dehydrogenase